MSLASLTEEGCGLGANHTKALEAWGGHLCGRREGHLAGLPQNWFKEEENSFQRYSVLIGGAFFIGY